MKEYVVIFEKSGTGYSASVPDLPGCIAVGSSLKEVGNLILDVIQFRLESMKKEGVPIPEPTTLAGTFVYE